MRFIEYESASFARAELLYCVNAIKQNESELANINLKI